MVGNVFQVKSFFIQYYGFVLYCAFKYNVYC